MMVGFPTGILQNSKRLILQAWMPRSEAAGQGKMADVDFF